MNDTDHPTDPTQALPKETSADLDMPSEESAVSVTGCSPSSDGASAAPRYPATVGRYRIEGEIARGGMGVVLRATDGTLGRTLAVKMLLPQHAGDAELERRFLEEACLTGQLQHPGIPPVYELGRADDGSPFFTMKLVKGRTLAELLRERASPAEDLPRWLGVFQQVCQAVGYAHHRGVIHRDLKPANVMVGAFGEVQVMDWGLAKVLAGGEATAAEGSTVITSRPGGEQTQAGSVLGTPAYMAPEQARGHVWLIDEQSDVFGLGGILCVVLTGKPPYQGPDAMRQARQADLADALARLDGCGAGPELVALAKRCLAPAPSRRPRHAGEVAEAVAAHLTAVQERLRTAERERAVATVRAAEERKRRRLTVIIAAGLLCLVSGAGTIALAYQASQARRSAELDRKVEAALTETEAARHRALERTDDPARWRAALEVAGSALARGEALLEQDPDTDADLKKRARGLREALAADQRDQALAEEVEKIRLEAEEKIRPETESGPARGWLPAEDGYPKLKEALRGWGLVVGADNPDAAGTAVHRRPAPVREKVVEALDLCLNLLASHPTADRETLHWFLGVLAAADPDPWRQRVRSAIVRRDRAALREFAGQPEAVTQRPWITFWMADALSDSAPEQVLRLLRRTRERYPADFSVHMALAGWLKFAAQDRWRWRDEGWTAFGDRLEETAMWYTVALRRKSELLTSSQLLDEAVVLYSAAVSYNVAHRRRQSELPTSSQLLDEAVVLYSVARALRPNSPTVHRLLASTLKEKGDISGAVASWREATRLAPQHAWAHNELGEALEAQGDLEGAIACFREVVRLAPKDDRARINLGIALRARGDIEGAEACHREAVRLSPKSEEAHLQLGITLEAKGDQRGAVVSFREATRERSRFQSACEIILVSTGQGRGAAGLSTEVRARLRWHALAWLRADLAAMTRMQQDGVRIPTNPVRGRAWPAGKVYTLVGEHARVVAIPHWYLDPDLASVREPGALAALPVAEAEAWRKLWSDADDLLLAAWRASR